MKLKKRISIITGAGQGIGKEIAIIFAKEGSSVIINDIDLALAQSVETEIMSLGGQALAVQADVSSKEDCKNLVQKTLNCYGKIDILINNAGIQTICPFLELPEEQWRRVLDVNLLSVFLLSQMVANEMIKNSGRVKGKIINMSSIHQDIPRFNKIHYDVSKAGLKILTKDMALELARFGINVNGIAPGAIATPMNKDILYETNKIEHLQTNIPLGRIGSAQEVAKLALYLASGDADYITGEIINIDGGKSLVGTLLPQAYSTK